MRSIVSLRHVLFLAIGVRLFLPLLAVIITGGDPLFHSRDTNSYIRPAAALIADGRFARNDHPEIMRTPGYPVFLIPGIASGHVEAVTIIFQVVLSTLTVVLVYGITMLLFERSEIAILSALLYAFEPLSILYSSWLLAETLFTSLIALFLYFLLRYWKGGSITHLLVSATALAASAYVKPISYYLPIVVSIFLFVWILMQKRQKSIRLAHLGVFLLMSIGLIGIWQIRNKVQAGYPGFSSASDLSLYYYQGASVLAVVEGTPIDEMKEKMGYGDDETYFRNFPDQRGWKKGEIVRSMGQAGLGIILSNPETYSVLVLRGILRTLLDPGATEYMRMFRLYPVADGLHNMIVEQGLREAVRFLFEDMHLVFWANLLLGLVLVSYLLLAILGVVESRIVFTLPMILFSGLTAYFLVFTAVGIGTSRARHPIMPMICVVAGYGLLRVYSRAMTRWSPDKRRHVSATSNPSLTRTGQPLGAGIHWRKAAVKQLIYRLRAKLQADPSETR